MKPRCLAVWLAVVLGLSGPADAGPAGERPQPGLYVVMRAGCPVCDVYTPRLKRLTAQGVPVQVVALDNLPLRAWPGALPDRGQARRLGVTGVPTTFLFQNGRMTELGAGLIPETVLLRRLGNVKPMPGRTGRPGS